MLFFGLKSFKFSELAISSRLRCLIAATLGILPSTMAELLSAQRAVLLTYEVGKPLSNLSSTAEPPVVSILQSLPASLSRLMLLSNRFVVSDLAINVPALASCKPLIPEDAAICCY